MDVGRERPAVAQSREGAAIGGEELGRAILASRDPQAGSGIADRAGHPQRVAGLRAVPGRINLASPDRGQSQHARCPGGERHGVSAQQGHVEGGQCFAQTDQKRLIPILPRQGIAQ